MLTYTLMGILALGIAVSSLWGVKYDSNKSSFMSITDTSFLRGFWCIIVVLVHVPSEYQNPVQDMLGSFAYIGVTFFFMTSAYGLKWSLLNKKGYMNHFWRRRLPNLLIPALMANAISVLASTTKGNTITALDFININNWVKVLLLYYVIFWIVYHIIPKVIHVRGYWQDLSMCLIVCGLSLLERMSSFHITWGWIVEPLGFAYGIIVANHTDEIIEWLNDKWIIKNIGLMLLACFLGVTYLKFKPVLFVGDYLLKVVLGIVITALIFTVLNRLTVGNRVNSFLGSISYEVYLVHHSVFALIMAIDKTGIDSGVFILSSVIITLALAVGLKTVSDPISKKLSNIGR